MFDKKRILIIDDDPNLLFTIKSVLEPEGYHIWTKETALEAFHHLDSIRPDLILLDIRLPILDGIDFLHIVLNLQMSIKVIIMTAFDDVSRERATFMGAANFIQKPFKPEALKVLIEETFS